MYLYGVAWGVDTILYHVYDYEASIEEVVGYQNRSGCGRLVQTPRIGDILGFSGVVQCMPTTANSR
jgi:hypothetical protein